MSQPSPRHPAVPASSDVSGHLPRLTAWLEDAGRTLPTPVLWCTGVRGSGYRQLHDLLTTDCPEFTVMSGEYGTLPPEHTLCTVITHPAPARQDVPTLPGSQLVVRTFADHSVDHRADHRAAAHPQALLLDAQPTTTQLTQLQATVHAAAADALPAWLRACVHAELVHASEDADTVELLALADLQIAAP